MFGNTGGLGGLGGFPGTPARGGRPGSRQVMTDQELMARFNRNQNAIEGRPVANALLDPNHRRNFYNQHGFNQFQMANGKAVPVMNTVFGDVGGPTLTTQRAMPNMTMQQDTPGGPITTTYNSSGVPDAPTGVQSFGGMWQDPPGGDFGSQIMNGAQQNPNQADYFTAANRDARASEHRSHFDTMMEARRQNQQRQQSAFDTMSGHHAVGGLLPEGYEDPNFGVIGSQARAGPHTSPNATTGRYTPGRTGVYNPNPFASRYVDQKWGL